MTIPNEILQKFFQYEIAELDDSKVDIFLSNYSTKEVIQCLINELESLAALQDKATQYDWAWRLGQIFNSISSKYSADVQTYSTLFHSTLTEKKILMNFLSGYWYGGIEANLGVVVNVAQKTVNAITNFDELSLDREVIFLAIKAVAVGYLNNIELFAANKELENKIVPMLKILKTYIVSHDTFKSPGYELLSKFLQI